MNARNRHRQTEKVVGVDYASAYPQYTDKLAIKNVNATRHLISKTKKVSQLIWECGLRDHGVRENKNVSSRKRGRAGKS